jgi:hypothetical protein
MATSSIVATAASGTAAAAAAAQQPPAAAAIGANSSISSQLRCLADQLDGASGQACAKQVGEALQVLAEQLLRNIQEQELRSPTGQASGKSAGEVVL